MKKLLFVNACMRGKEKSRTYALAEQFVQALADKYELEIVDLSELDLQYLKGERVEWREELLHNQQTQHPEFELARQFAAADRIVVAAPFWDLTIPAALRVYIENIAALNIVFKYQDGGDIKGLCRAEKLLFISSCGGEVGVGMLENFELATPYLQGICKMFGILEYDSLLVDGLDIYGADVASKLCESKIKLLQKAEVF